MSTMTSETTPDEHAGQGSAKHVNAEGSNATAHLFRNLEFCSMFCSQIKMRVIYLVSGSATLFFACYRDHLQYI